MKSVFISSTFKDMQSERDYLHQYIFPRLRKVMANYGQDIQELDLRWGVDTMHMTEEESGHEVIKVCIDAIDRCRPFIIVLLGERYGWIPDDDILKTINDERVENNYVSNSSITDLEIRYGALSSDEAFENTIFCFRNASLIDEIEEEYQWMYASESEVHANKLNHLKQIIQKKNNSKIIHYDAQWDSIHHKVIGLEAFGEQVFTILSDLIEKEFGHLAPVSSYDQLQNEMKQMQESYLSTYIPRHKEEYEILNFIHEYFKDFNKYKNNALYLKGHAGSGKSAIMAYVASVLKNAPSPYPHLLYFSGGPGAQSLNVLKDVLIQTLEKEFNISSQNETNSINMRLDYLNNEINIPFVVFIDAIDQLLEGEENLVFDLCKLCPRICFIISYLDTFPIEQVQDSSISHKTIEVSSLNKQQIIKFIESTSKKRGKKLDDEVIQSILNLKEASNPLYLSMVLQRFFMMDGKEFQEAEKLSSGMTGLHLYMNQLLLNMPETTKEMIRYLLSESSQHFKMDEFTMIIQLLATSNLGFTEYELEELFAYNNNTFKPIKFQQIISYLYDAFSQRQNGKWYFNHRLFYEAIKEEISTDEKDAILDAFIQLAIQNKDFLNSEGYYYLLTLHHPSGYLAFENLYENTIPDFTQFLAHFMMNENHFDYLLELIKTHDSNKIFNYWLNHYHYSLYSTNREHQLSKIIHQLLIHPNRQPREVIEMITKLIRHIIIYCTSDQLVSIISIYKQYATTLDTSYYYLLARYHYIVEKNENVIDEINKAYELSQNEKNEDLTLQVHYWYIRFHSNLKKIVLLNHINKIIDHLKTKAEPFHKAYLARFLYLRFSIYPNAQNFDTNLYVQYYNEAETYLSDLLKEVPTFEFYELLNEIYISMHDNSKQTHRYLFLEKSIPLYKKLNEISPSYSYQYNIAWATVSYARSKWLNENADKADVWEKWQEGLALFETFDRIKAKESFCFYVSIYATQLLSEKTITQELSQSASYYLNQAIHVLTTEIDLSDTYNCVTLLDVYTLMMKLKDRQFDYRNAEELIQKTLIVLKKVQPVNWMRSFYLKALFHMISYSYHSRLDANTLSLISLYESQFNKEEDTYVYYEINYTKARLALENQQFDLLNHILTTILNVNITDNILFNQKLALLKAEAAYRQNQIFSAYTQFNSLVTQWVTNHYVYPIESSDGQLYVFYQAYCNLIYGDLLRENKLHTTLTRSGAISISNGKYEYVSENSYGGSEYAKAYQLFSKISSHSYKQALILRIAPRPNDSEEFSHDKYNMINEMSDKEIMENQHIIIKAIKHPLNFASSYTNLWKTICRIVKNHPNIEIHDFNKQTISEYFFLLGEYEEALKHVQDATFKKLILSKKDNDSRYLPEIQSYISELHGLDLSYAKRFQVLVYHELKVRHASDAYIDEYFAEFIKAANTCKYVDHMSNGYEDHYIVVKLLLEFAHLDYLNRYNKNQLSILAYFVNHIFSSITKETPFELPFSEVLHLEHQFVLTNNRRFEYVGLHNNGENSILNLYPNFKHLCTKEDLLTLIKMYKILSPAWFYEEYASIRRDISIQYLQFYNEEKHLSEIEEFLITHNTYNDFIQHYRFSNVNDIFSTLYQETNDIQWLEKYYHLLSKKNVLQEISVEDSHYLEALKSFLPHYKEDIEQVLNRTYEINVRYVILHINFYGDHYQKKSTKQLYEYYQEFHKIRTDFLKELRSIF